MKHGSKCPKSPKPERETIESSTVQSGPTRTGQLLREANSILLCKSHPHTAPILKGRLRGDHALREELPMEEPTSLVAIIPQALTAFHHAAPLQPDF